MTTPTPTPTQTQTQTQTQTRIQMLAPRQMPSNNHIEERQIVRVEMQMVGGVEITPTTPVMPTTPMHNKNVEIYQ